MRNKLIYLGLIIYLFLTTTTAYFLDIKQVGTFSCIVLISLFVSNLSKKYCGVINRCFPQQFNLILIAVLSILFQYSIGYKNQINFTLFTFIVPSIIFFLLFFQSQQVTKILLYIVLSFFIVECVLAMYERFFQVNVFPFETIDSENLYVMAEKWLFRSSALLGHPLANALGVSIILGFIICSDFSKTLKLRYLIIGFIALLCFNARGAILLWVGLGSYYFVSILFNRKSNVIIKMGMLVLFLSVILGIGYLLFSTTLGGRLVHEDKILDGSANTRIEVLSSFQYMTDFDLTVGNPDNYAIITKKLQAGGVENSYIVFIIQYGLIFAILLFRSIFFVIKKILDPYSLKEKIILIMAFIGVGSTNNGLASPSPWIIFFVCASIFYKMKLFKTTSNEKNIYNTR